MTTLLHRQREAKLTDAQLTALDLLCTHGPARMSRAGWAFNSAPARYIAPNTMTAMIARGLAQKSGSDMEATAAARALHHQITRGAA